MMSEAPLRSARRRQEGLIIGAAIGLGLTAQAAERGGADFLLALNAGRLRGMGAASITCLLPLNDANAFTDGFARAEILGRVSVPVLFGACAQVTGPDPRRFCSALAEAGYAGLANFPSVVHLDGAPRAALEASGLGLACEAALLAEGKAAGLTTLGYAKTRGEVEVLVAAKVDMLCLNFGWNAGGTLGAPLELSLEEAADRARRIFRDVRAAAPDTLCLVEGGPLVSPEEVWRVCVAGRADGYVGGSTLDRLPLEAAVAQSTSAFKALSLEAPDPDAAARRAARLTGLVGGSAAMAAVLARLARLAPGRLPMLIAGEEGSGRSRVARAAHVVSGLQGLAVLEAASPEELDLALGRAGGTLILEDVGAMPPSLQRHLAARIEAGFRPRLVTTLRTDTGRDLLPGLRALLEPGWIDLPPLRDRPEDLPVLAQHLLRRLPDGARRELAPDALRLLIAQTWPGNLRELRSVLERAAFTANTTRLRVEDLEPLLTGGSAAPSAPPGGEREWILDALRRHRFRRGETAAFLGLSRKTLYNHMKRLGLLN